MEVCQDAFSKPNLEPQPSGRTTLTWRLQLSSCSITPPLTRRLHLDAIGVCYIKGRDTSWQISYRDKN